MSFEYWTDICACGHPISRHVLVGTEYCRCESYPGECPCSGGARVALRVREDVERPTGAKTNARFFRRRYMKKSPHPLNAGIKKIVEEDGYGPEFLEWAAEECDWCGEAYSAEEGLTAYWASRDGNPIVSPDEQVTGRTLLLCNGCVLDVLWEQNVT